MSLVALIDYGSGNVRSVRRALEAAAVEHDVDLSVKLTDRPEDIETADRIVLPGVGHFADCAQELSRRSGVVDAISRATQSRAVPFLGVCVGMQLMSDLGREDAETPGLGWIGGVVERIQPDSPRLPVPHMGWNSLSGALDHPVLAGLGEEPEVYFTHSYVFRPSDAVDVAAWCDYGGAFAAAVSKGVLFGTQFHPEKSQKAGLRLLANFLTWKP